MPTISVIIPVYKVEAFLARCLDSLINQSYQDWEAICVDDASPDSCPSILDEYAIKDSRFIIVHKQNAGQASARNLGISMASGKYSVFMDSDDFLHPQALEICKYMADRDESDLVVYTYNHPYYTLNKIKHKLHIPGKERPLYKHYDISRINSLVTEDVFSWASESSSCDTCPNSKWLIKHCQVWRCLYRTERINQIKCIEIPAYEDFPWWGEVLQNTRKATIINLPLYFYCHNGSSSLNSSSRLNLLNSLKIAIDAAMSLNFDHAHEYQRELWNRNFIVPFKHILDHMEKRYKRSCRKSQ